MRHRANRTQPNAPAPRVAQILPRGQEYRAFLGDGPSNGPQSLTGISGTLSQLPGRMNDLASEEVILKP